MGRIREAWRSDKSWGTVIALYGCSFGLEMNGQCHELFCRFRCDKTEAPREPVKIGELLCPRIVEYEEDHYERAPHLKPGLVSS